MVEDGLNNFGVQNFIPLVEDTKIINGRHVRLRRPLLGRYILFTIVEHWPELLSLRGVAGILLTADNEPAVVVEKELSDIRSLCVGNIYCPRVVRSKNGFYYGQRVTPKEGPFAYHVGFFEGVKSRNREVALFKLFGREQKVTFKSGDLIAA